MTDGGAIAKSRFRYQDMCAIYFLLWHFLQDKSAVERIRCEQDKMDFEVLCKDNFNGYQVKDKKQNITAKTANQILKDCINKASKSGKEKQNFWFIFSSKPNNSLGYLFLWLNNKSGVRQHKKATQDYLDTALNGIELQNITIDYHCHDPQEMEHLVFGISTNVLKNELTDNINLEYETIRNFIARLRDEIDIASSAINSFERYYELSRMNNLIRSFTRLIIKTNLTEEGTNVTTSIISDKREPLNPTNTVPDRLSMLGENKP